jgi:error-prone DNA polymerase
MHEINAQSLRQFQFSQVRTKTDPADALNIAQAARTLYLSKPQTLQNTRVSCSAARDNLTLWISEYDRLRKEIASLRNQIRILDHEPASEVSRVRALRQDHLRDLQERQAEVTREIERVYALLDDRQAQLLHSIPGIGRLTTATALVVIRDLSRFASAEALKAYLGTYPVRRQSGAHESPAHLARHGNQLMRHMLWNAARAAVRHKHPQNPFRLLFDRLTAKHKSYPCAIGAVVRKLVQTIYGVLKTQTAFHFPNPTP